MFGMLGPAANGGTIRIIAGRAKPKQAETLNGAAACSGSPLLGSHNNTSVMQTCRVMQDARGQHLSVASE